MPHVVYSFGVPVAKTSIMEDIDKIAANQRKSRSELIVSVLENYASMHINDPPTPKERRDPYGGIPGIDPKTRSSELRAKILEQDWSTESRKDLLLDRAANETDIQLQDYFRWLLDGHT